MNVTGIDVEVERVPRPRDHAAGVDHEADAVATMCLEVGRGPATDPAEEDETVLIETEYFDAGYVGDDALEVDDETVAETDAGEVGARAAARLARQVLLEAEQAQRLESSGRRHGVLGVAMALVLAYQVAPAVLPGGHIGINVFLAALGYGLWSARRQAPSTGERAKGGRRRADAERTGWISQRRATLIDALGWAGLALLAVACWAPDPTNIGGRFAPLAVLATVLVLLGATTEPPGPLVRVLTAAPLRLLGQMSFPLLGVLLALFGVAPAVSGWEPNASARVGAGVLAVVIGYSMMRHMERSRAAQIERARHRSGHVVGLTACAAAVALTLTATDGGSEPTDAAEFVAAVGSTPLDSAELNSAELPSDASAEPSVDLPFADRCWSIPPAFATATCTFGGSKADVSVALTGDQTAGAWLPALQGMSLAKGWRITTYLAADCTPGVVSADGACRAWTERVGKAVKSGGFDLIVVGGGSGEAGGAFGEALRRAGHTVIGMPDLMAPKR